LDGKPLTPEQLGEMKRIASARFTEEKPTRRRASLERALLHDYGLKKVGGHWQYSGSGNRDMASALNDSATIIRALRRISEQVGLNGLCCVAGRPPLVVMRDPKGAKGPFCWATSLSGEQITDVVAALALASSD
jgi:hypothetical protein